MLLSYGLHGCYRTLYPIPFTLRAFVLFLLAVFFSLCVVSPLQLERASVPFFIP